MRDVLRRLEMRLYARMRDPAAARVGDQDPDPWDPTQLRNHTYCLLISFRRSGVPVATPVWFGIEGERLYARTGPQDGKVKRIRRDPRVLVAPCTLRGRPLGRAMRGQARILGPDEEHRAELALRSNYGLGRRIYGLIGGQREASYLEISAPSPGA